MGSAFVPDKYLKMKVQKILQYIKEQRFEILKKKKEIKEEKFKTSMVKVHNNICKKLIFFYFFSWQTVGKSVNFSYSQPK